MTNIIKIRGESLQDFYEIKLHLSTFEMLKVKIFSNFLESSKEEKRRDAYAKLFRLTDSLLL